MPLPEPYRSKVRELRRAFGLLPPDRLASNALFNVGNDDLHTNGEGLFLRLCGPGWRNAMDVGANEGRWTAALLGLNPHCHVTCIEPNPAVASRLAQRFCGHNHYVDVLEAAAGSEEGFVILNVNEREHVFSSIHRASEDTKPLTVRQTTVDLCCRSAGITYLDGLKIDTEGNELAVLEGAKEMIARNAVYSIQFEFGDNSWTAGTKLRDLYDILLPTFEIFNLSGDGLLAAPYRPNLETFGYSNWLALARVFARPPD